MIYSRAWAACATSINKAPETPVMQYQWCGAQWSKEWEGGLHDRQIG